MHIVAICILTGCTRDKHDMPATYERGFGVVGMGRVRRKTGEERLQVGK